MQKLGSTQKYIGIAVGVVLLVGSFGFLAKNKNQSSASTEEIPLVQTLAVNSNGNGAQNYSYSGVIRGRYEKQLAFQVSGKIIRRNIDVGSVVTKGETLVQIDPVDIRQGVVATNAQLLAAESQFKLAKENLERFKELYNQKLMSQAEFDRYQTAYDAAEAGLRQAKAQYSSGVNQYNYCTLYADNSGIVAGVNVETGQIVGAGQPVVSIVSGDEREVEINVPENRLEDLNPAQKCQVSFWAIPDLTVAGTIREISPVADAVTRTYKVRITLVNPPSTLKLGMTATVMIAGPNGALATYIPLTAIYQTDGAPEVWVVQQGVVRLKAVKLGAYGEGDQIQVLEGVKSGDVIVTAGVHKLREGEKVRIGDEQP